MKKYTHTVIVRDPLDRVNPDSRYTRSPCRLTKTQIIVHFCNGEWKYCRQTGKELNGRKTDWVAVPESLEEI